MAKEQSTFNHYSDNRRINIRLTGDGPEGELCLSDQVHGFLDFLTAQGWAEESIYKVIQDAIG